MTAMSKTSEYGENLFQDCRDCYSHLSGKWKKEV